MGTWTHLLGKYPEKKIALDNLKKASEKLSMAQLEQVVSHRYQLVKELGQKKSVAYQEYIAASEVLLERWQDDDTQSVKRDHIGQLTRVDDVRASVNDIDVFKQWEKDQGLASLVQETVNKNSLSSVVKKMLENGDEIPACVSLFIQSRVKVTKPKGAKT